MAFLTAEDYKSLIQEEDLEIYTQSDTDTRQRAEVAAQEDISSYLRSSYDMEASFSAAGLDRNAKLVEVMCDLAIWNLLASQSYRAVSELRTTRYKEAIKWLQGVQAGKLSPNLPKYAAESGKGRTFRYGSQPPRTHLI